MPFRVVVDGGTDQEIVDRNPEQCPVCFHAVEPKDLQIARKVAGGVDRAFQCPRGSCKRVFVARYGYSPGDRGHVLRDVVPKSRPTVGFPRLISENYPQFVDIFSQAFYAESLELSEICGAGYRRSLEFLIKTYLLAQQTDKAKQAEIRKLMLGPCIAKFVTNPNLRDVADRATWLGNDETHFERRWETKDLQDLKNAIELTATWVEMELQTAKLIEAMPKKVKETVP
jgi:hypothetical protein